jgi:beta-mannanase
MNGNWYPWAASVNGNTAATYIAAWRHVHDIFSEYRATSVLWVWCPNAGGPTPMDEVYPGNKYVDILGIDGYNWGSATVAWQSPQQIFSSYLSALSSLAPDKPMLINETGTGEAGGDKGQWIQSLLSFVKAYPHLVGVVYSDFGAVWPLDTSRSAMAGARQGLVGY